MVAPVLAGRVAAAAERGARPDVVGRPATAAALRGGRVRRRRAAPSRGEAGHDGPMASFRTSGPAVGGSRPVGPALCGKLVPQFGPGDLVADDDGRGALVGSVLREPLVRRRVAAGRLEGEGAPT